MRRRSIPLAELALAYELRQCGCQWKTISKGLGWDTDRLRSAVAYMVKHGIKRLGT